MKITVIILCSIMLLSNGLADDDIDKGEFCKKVEAYNKLVETEKYKAIVNAIKSELPLKKEKQQLIELLKVFEGSTIKELSAIFEVERSDDGSCWWITKSTHCQHCRNSLFKCGIFTSHKPCIKYQLEYCSGGYWSGRDRVSEYTVCC